uniref:Uncharacterized protein n=1 Tax=Lepeophtheirus salmonis TaxID=72036 RepID=A0A0K2U394_LEPSM
MYCHIFSNYILITFPSRNNKLLSDSYVFLFCIFFSRCSNRFNSTSHFLHTS